MPWWQHCDPLTPTQVFARAHCACVHHAPRGPGHVLEGFHACSGDSGVSKSNATFSELPIIPGSVLHPGDPKVRCLGPYIGGTHQRSTRHTCRLHGTGAVVAQSVQSCGDSIGSVRGVSPGSITGVKSQTERGSGARLARWCFVMCPEFVVVVGQEGCKHGTDSGRSWAWRAVGS